MKRYTLIFAFLILLLAVLIGWFFFTHKTSSTTPFSFGGFGTPNNISGQNTTVPQNANPQTILLNSSGNIAQIFKISDGPVTSATFIQSRNPTTTIVRYINQGTGHVQDIQIAPSFEPARNVSNTTIPSISQAVWVENGGAAIVQYTDSGNVKTVYEQFQKQASSSTVTEALRVQFLPDNMLTFAVSPGGANIAYMLAGPQGGSVGYTALSDGSKTKRLFSFPLSQVLLSWPATSTLMLQTKSAENISGVVSSINTNSGVLTSLVYGQGITAIANKDFSKILYQTRLNNLSNTYIHNFKNNSDSEIPFPVIPEKCLWSTFQARIYCAYPTSPIDSSYLDAWHKGLVTDPNFVVFYDFNTGTLSAEAIPGKNGGLPKDISELKISPDDQYLMYISKGDRSLWGIRITQ